MPKYLKKLYIGQLLLIPRLGSGNELKSRESKKKTLFFKKRRMQYDVA